MDSTSCIQYGHLKIYVTLNENNYFAISNPFSGLSVERSLSVRTKSDAVFLSDLRPCLPFCQKQRRFVVFTMK